MNFIYRLVGENLELAEAELKGFLRSQNVDESPEREKELCFTDSNPSQLKRLGLVHEVSELIDRTESLETDYRPENSFAVKAHDLTGEANTEEIEKKLGSILESEENEVELEDPEEVINLYVIDEEYVIGREIEDIDRGMFNRRKNQKRPFSSPVSMDPVLARVLVNLSEVPAGGTVLDPFCGTGGILIEAGLCGILPRGTDIQEEMIEGARENLEEYGIINHDLKVASIEEAREKFEEKADGVVTDLPYGKASKSEGKPVEKFLKIAPELTDGKIVFMYDKPELEGLEADFEIYVHKNLTRYIYTSL